MTYDRPATRWTEALPIGNGRLGAMVFGGTEDERLQVNEGTLWGGRPHDYTDPDASVRLDEIRRLIFAGNVAEAEKLSEAVMGRPKLLMPYQPFCDVRVHFPGHGQATAYQRELRLDDATVETSYTVGTTEFRREVFASFPAQVLVLRLTASRPGQVTLSVGLDSPQQGTRVESTAPGTLQLTGQIQPRQNPARSWTGSWDEPGLRFAAVLQVLTEGGSVRGAGSTLAISGADAVTIVFSAATSFRTYRDIGGDALARAREILTRASHNRYDRLRRAHVDDFGRLFSRVQLRLGEDRSTETTDRRIKRFAETEDPSLLALYHAFGRYLLISVVAARRPACQSPGNLERRTASRLEQQVDDEHQPGDELLAGGYGRPVGNAGAAVATIRGLRETGAETARAHYGAQGWVLHHNTDLWRATTPVDGAWGLWPMGQAWLANQMWDHYDFSGDREFLRQHAYPAMKEAAQFVLDTLVTRRTGRASPGAR